MLIASATGSLPTQGRIASCWKRTWFGPISSFNFALFRTGLGVVMLIWYLTLLQDLQAFFGANGLLPNSGYSRSGLSVFRLFPSDAVLWVATLWATVASLLLVVGRFTRVAGPVLAVVTMSLMAENATLWNSGDELLQTFLLLFACYCLATPSVDLDVSLRASIATSDPLQFGRSWLFRLVQVQVTLVYLIAFLSKVPGESWRDGTAVMMSLRLETMERFYVPPWFETSFVAGTALTWASLVLEGALPILLWNRRARSYAVAAAVVFHVLIDWSLAIGLFSWIMILGLISFCSPDLNKTVTRPFDSARSLPLKPRRNGR